MNISVSYKISALLSLILIIIPVNYYFVTQSMKVLENDAFAINHIGLVRGSIQRLVKYAETGNKTDSIEVFIESTFKQIDQRYIALDANRVHFETTGLLSDYEGLKSCWKEIGMLIRKPEQRKQLMLVSELCWNYADATAFKAQTIAEAKRQQLLDSFLVRVGFAFFLVLMIITYVIIKVRKGLEQDIRLDPLTKLFNRKYFIESLEYHTSLTHRNKRDLSLLFIDIDHFKQINDTLGHQIGDDLLIRFGQKLQSLLRNSDLSFRFGGEEFVVITPECDLECAKTLAEKLRENIEKSDFSIGKTITISVGVAQLKQHEHAGELIRRSDNAMYLAKKEGRNRVVTV
jgi:diguanylate cyclase (GGDEF)-like protein